MTASIPVVVATALYIYGRAFFLGLMASIVLLGKQLISPTQWIFAVKRRDSPPKSLTDPKLGQHGYVTVKGLKFHYVEKGDRSKPLMLFVHGYPEFWYSWRHQMQAFSEDYWTVAIDNRGYGDSAKPPNVADYKLNLLVDDIKGIVTELGRKKFILVAHDWGAFISWAFVDTYPDMVEKYITMNGPHPSVFAKLMLESKKQSSKSWYVFLFQVPIIPEILAALNDFEMFDKLFLDRKKINPYVTSEDIEAFKYTFSKPGAITPPLNYYRAAMRKVVFEGFGAPPISYPTDGTRPRGLYIFGRHDIAIDVANVELHKPLIPNLETVILEGNHFIQQDEPKAVNDAMKEFLTK